MVRKNKTYFLKDSTLGSIADVKVCIFSNCISDHPSMTSDTFFFEQVMRKYKHVPSRIAWLLTKFLHNRPILIKIFTNFEGKGKNWIDVISQNIPS